MRAPAIGRVGSRRALVALGVLLSAMTTSIVLAAPGQASIKAPQLVSIALWHMDESTGKMIDSARNHDGSPSNLKQGVHGFRNKAYKFNGTSSEVIVPHASDLNPGTGTFTVTVYANLTKTPQEVGEDSFDMIRKGLTGGQYWKLEISTTGKFGCHFTGSSNTGDAPGVGPVLNDGVWHKLVCTKTSSRMQMFVDGLMVFDKAVTIGSASNTNVLSVGAKRNPNAGDSDFFKGRLDEISIESG